MDQQSVIDQVIETQGITVQRDAAGLTQLRKLQTEINVSEDSMVSPLMILRSERNQRRFEFHHRGKLVLTIAPDGTLRLGSSSDDLYEAFKDWVEKSVGM